MQIVKMLISKVLARFVKKPTHLNCKYLQIHLAKFQPGERKKK